VDVAKLVIESLIALTGLYLAHSFRRNHRLRIAEQRLESYRALWELMEVARPTRKQPWEGRRPLEREEAARLYNAMTHWYFGSGNGMLLTDRTKRLYLRAKERLGRYAASAGDDWRAGGFDRINELSLLRFQMKRDLDLYGVFYDEELDANGIELLTSAGIRDPDRWRARPWHDEVGAAVASFGWRLRRPFGGSRSKAPEPAGVTEPSAP
jgi:hypothetical protein